jgi:hypothetical protein
VTNFNETIGTLKFAERAKKIENVVSVNRDPMAQMVHTLQQENKVLRQRITTLEEKLAQQVR